MDGRLAKKVEEPAPASIAARAGEVKCPVCGSPSSLSDPDQLCWICRRLKVSAWRDNDHTMPSQE